jgi:selenoprotein W-related protein
MADAAKPSVAITYCTQCNWLLRAGWMAQELLQTFGLELNGVTLLPGTGGIFQITVDGDLLWDRKRDGGFPDVKTLKRLVRDRVDPGRDLGHIDRAAASAADPD